MHRPDLDSFGDPYSAAQTGPSNFQENVDCRYDIVNVVVLANGIGNNKCALQYIAYIKCQLHFKDKLSKETCQKMPIFGYFLKL